MSEYVNVAFLNARNDLRLFLCDLKDASHLPWAFSTLRWSFIFFGDSIWPPMATHVPLIFLSSCSRASLVLTMEFHGFLR